MNYFYDLPHELQEHILQFNKGFIFEKGQIFYMKDRIHGKYLIQLNVVKRHKKIVLLMGQRIFKDEVCGFATTIPIPKTIYDDMIHTKDDFLNVELGKMNISPYGLERSSMRWTFGKD
tara:strand:- start:107 stop:460 length:354 start_codon:yes stop_codon:yes gene_type:complete